MKNLFSLLLSEFFPSIDNILDGKEISKEVQTFDKGDFKTTITHYFDRSGRLVGNKTETKSKAFIPSEEEEMINQKTLELKEVVEKEDYLRAAELKNEIKELENKIKSPA